jgi:hypothetical protein
VISGKNVPVNVAAPVVGGVSRVHAAYTPVPSAALDMGTKIAVAATVVARAVVRAMRVRRFTHT